ncbi:MAG: hypothetical protein Q4E57_10215, partial [Eubacteriales bacterium]|nr:hypothetical protein [Eubacteriales bacterium]
MRNFVKDKKNIIKALLVGYMAAFVLVMFAFCVKEVPVEEKKEQKVPEVTKINVKDIHYVKPVSTLKEISAAEEEGEFEPAPDKLNLAYIFPEDADESDSINSYAGKIYTAINALNASYYASYYDLTDTTPLSMASQYGLGASRVLGKYNPKDASHNPNNSSTWTVNQFKNVNVSFYDGDGNRINGYYDAQEVMALASVYAYYHDFTDAEAMEDYCRKLFDSAVTAKVSLGNVYYCSGCLNRTVEQEASEAIAIENQQAELENSLGDNSHGWIAVDASGQPTTRIYATTEATSSADENVVVSYGKSALQTIEVGTTAYENFGYAVANSDLTATIPASTSAASSGDGAGYASQYTETAQYTETQPYQTVQYSETAAASSEQYVQSTEYSENAVVSSGSGSSSVIISPETTAAAASYNSNADNQVVVSQGTASQGGAAQDASSQGGASQDASSGGFDTYVTPEPEITGEVIFESVYDGGVEYLNGDNSVDDQVVVSAGTGYQPETEAAQYDSGAAGASAASEASAEVTSGAVTSEASSETATAAASETAAEASDTSSNNSSETSGVIIASGSSTATAGRRPSVDEREVVSYGVSAAAEMSSAAAESEAAAAAAAAGYGNSEADQNGNAYNITGETLADGTVVYNNLSTVAAGETVSGMTGTGTTGTAGT